MTANKTEDTSPRPASKSKAFIKLPSTPTLPSSPDETRVNTVASDVVHGGVVDTVGSAVVDVVVCCGRRWRRCWWVDAGHVVDRCQRERSA